MKVLSISTDRKVFEKGSAVRSRLLEYGKLVEELHVIVFAKKKFGFSDEKISPNIFLYPTNSLSSYLHIPSAILRALKLKQRGFLVDVVTTQDPFETGVAGYIIARAFKARLHFQIHTDFMSPYFSSESLLNRARVVFAKFLIPRADAVRVVSLRIQKSIERIVSYGVSITVLPILVEAKKIIESPENNLRKKYPQFDKILLVASRLTREKNIDMAIEAMRTIIQKYPKVGLVIVGEGPKFLHMKNLTQKYSLSSNVMFEGWQLDLTPYYKSADAFLLTSNYEGYGMTVVEAMSASCPVIMTDVGCAGEVVKDHENGLIVPVGDTLAFTQAIIGIISGNVEIRPVLENFQTKEEYLFAYKKSWENTLAEQKIYC